MMRGIGGRFGGKMCWCRAVVRTFGVASFGGARLSILGCCRQDAFPSSFVPVGTLVLSSITLSGQSCKISTIRRQSKPTLRATLLNTAMEERVRCRSRTPLSNAWLGRESQGRSAATLSSMSSLEAPTKLLKLMISAIRSSYIQAAIQIPDPESLTTSVEAWYQPISVINIACVVGLAH